MPWARARVQLQYTRVSCTLDSSWTRFSLAEIVVLVGGAIPPAPAVPASTNISVRLKRVQEDSSRVREGRRATT